MISIFPGYVEPPRRKEIAGIVEPYGYLRREVATCFQLNEIQHNHLILREVDLITHGRLFYHGRDLQLNPFNLEKCEHEVKIFHAGGYARDLKNHSQINDQMVRVETVRERQLGLEVVDPSKMFFEISSTCRVPQAQLNGIAFKYRQKTQIITQDLLRNLNLSLNAFAKYLVWHFAYYVHFDHAGIGPIVHGNLTSNSIRLKFDRKWVLCIDGWDYSRYNYDFEPLLADDCITSSIAPEALSRETALATQPSNDLAQSNNGVIRSIAMDYWAIGMILLALHRNCTQEYLDTEIKLKYYNAFPGHLGVEDWAAFYTILYTFIPEGEEYEWLQTLLQINWKVRIESTRRLLART
jgi:hypothetical protein